MDLLLKQIIKPYCSHGKIILSSGQESDYYIDCRKLLLDSSGLSFITESLSDHIREDVFYIGGPAMGAIPIVSAILLKKRELRDFKGLKGFYVRSERKGHGTENLIEGHLEKNASIILFDDVITTGKSIINTIEAIKDYNCEILAVRCIVDREQGARAAIENLGIPFQPLLTISELKC